MVESRRREGREERRGEEKRKVEKGENKEDYPYFICFHSYGPLENFCLRRLTDTLFFCLFSIAEKGLEVRIMVDALTNYFKYLLRRNLSELMTKTAAIASKGNLTATQIQVFVCTI